MAGSTQDPSSTGAGAHTAPPTSVFQKRWRKFKTLKRGYYSFLILVVTYLLSFLLPFIINNKALVVKYEGKYYYPVVGKFYQGKVFGQFNDLVFYGESQANYRLLQARCRAQPDKGNWVIMPLIPYNAEESAEIFKERKMVEAFKKGDFSADKEPSDDEEEEEDWGEEEEDWGEMSDAKKKAQTFPYPPGPEHIFGSDRLGRSLIARLAYGYNISLTFAMLLLMSAYIIGLSVGSVLGFYGGWVDLLGQRVIEVWQTVPFLLTVMILGAALQNYEWMKYDPNKINVMQPRFILLVLIMAAFSWMGITYYIRGEFLREKARDYVSAAISIGTPNRVIIFKHILPNALTPVVTFAPFALVSNISALVALDYLGFGLPPPTPSWGELMGQALEDLTKWWLVAAPISALFLTLLLVVFVGEAIREAFDPKVFSRLR